MFKCGITGETSLPKEKAIVLVRRRPTDHAPQYGERFNGEPYVKFPGGTGDQIVQQMNVRAFSLNTTTFFGNGWTRLVPLRPPFSEG